MEGRYTPESYVECENKIEDEQDKRVDSGSNNMKGNMELIDEAHESLRGGGDRGKQTQRGSCTMSWVEKQN